MEREVLKKSLVIVSISFFFMMTFFMFDHGFSLTGFAIFSESGSSFDNGTYVNTTYNGTGVVLSGSALTGTYISRVYNAGSPAIWNTLLFNSSIHGELSNNGQGSLMYGNILLLHLNEASGSVSDDSGNNNDGVNVGVSTGADGKLNSAYDFGTGSDYISIADANMLSFGDGSDDAPFSISLWFKADVLGAYGALIGKWNAYTNKDEYLLYVNPDDKIRFLVRDASSEADLAVISSSFDKDVWYNVIATYDGSGDASGMKLFVNGIEDTLIDVDDAAYVAMENTNQNLIIGHFTSRANVDYYFDGTMDEIVLWNRTLSLSEIQEIYTKGALSLDLKVKSCDDSACLGETWIDVSDKSPVTIPVVQNQYFQYAFNFSSDNSTLTSFLSSVLLDYDLVNEAPEISILSPQQDATYGYNESLSLDYVVTDINDNVAVCWYSLDGGANVSIPSCANTTFDVSGDGTYSLTLFVNDTLGEIASSTVSFTVQVGAPTIILNSPVHASSLSYGAVSLVYTPSDIDLETCTLYGNFSGSFIANQTHVSPVSDAQNNFLLNLSDGFYKWNVWCNDSIGNGAFNGNKTFIVDTTAPSVILNEPMGTKDTRTITMDFTPFDLHLNTCFYSVSRGGNVEIANTTISCSSPGSFDVTLDADFVFTIYANDSAGNIASKNSSFSVDTSSPAVPSVPSGGGTSSGGGGGGGGSFSSSSFDFSEFNLEIDPLRGILIPLEEKSFYVTVKNTGRTAINKCHIVSDDTDNFESSLRTNIASGEIIDFPVILRVSNSIPRLFIECVEGSKDLPLDFVIYEKTLDAAISQIELGSGEIILSYTLRSDFGFNDEITFEVKGSDGSLLNAITEQKSFGSNESYVGEVVISLPEKATGLLTVSIILDDTVLVDDTIIYGNSMITGLVTSGVFGDVTSVFVWLLFGMFNVFAFFVIRKVWTNIQYVHNTVSSRVSSI